MQHSSVGKNQHLFNFVLQVRKMPLKVFKEQYGGDMKSVVLKDMDEIRAASKAATSKLLATNRKLRTGATVPATQVSTINAPARFTEVMISVQQT